MTLRYAYYADDFTGATDVLEQLAEGGLSAVLFLRFPDKRMRAKFPNVEAIGLAGNSRSRSPQWMEENLPSIYSMLSEADIVHYKTCSTFDSSPEIGSIGKAVEIGLREFPAPAAVVVAAPYMGRYVVFRNLYASAGDDVYRIDRHPTMSQHPVTPMHEADLIRHLSLQTDLSISHLSLNDMKNIDRAKSAFREVEKKSNVVLFDGISLDDLEVSGALLLWRKIRFAVGSSGVTRALVDQWRHGERTGKDSAMSYAAEVMQLLVISGSCSPVTAKQVKRARDIGYQVISVDVNALLNHETQETERIIETANAAFISGRSCIISTADGPLEGHVKAAGEFLGQALGRMAKAIVKKNRLPRIIFAGGDTSSYGVVQLGVDALTWLAPIEAGAPLVRAHSEDPAVNGLEMVLKGGQMGGESFFESARRGRTVQEA